MKRGQASFEYILLIALIFVFSVPIFFFFLSSQKDTQYELDISQAEASSQAIVDGAESVFFTGIGSRNTIGITFPEQILDVAIVDQRELVVTLDGPYGITDLLTISRVNLTIPTGCGVGECTVSSLATQGLRQITLEAQEGEVLLTVG